MRDSLADSRLSVYRQILKQPVVKCRMAKVQIDRVSRFVRRLLADKARRTA